MKNPFKKDNYKTIVLVGTILSLATAAAAYLFLSDRRKNTRKGLKKKIKSIAKDAAVNAIIKKTEIKKKAVKAIADHVVKTD